MRVYAARNKKTGKLVSDITYPGHKFWTRKNDCEAAINKYQNSQTWYRRKDYDLELVVFELVEVNDAGE